MYLPVSLLGYELLSRFGRNAMMGWLAAISLFFYGYWNPAYLLLLGCSILMNFAFAKLIHAAGPEREAQASRWLAIGIVCNLLLLMYYKYLFPFLNFLHGRGVLSHGFAEVVLPLGISFFTFTQIAYLIDLKQGIAKAQGLLGYTVFVTFFPHLIAGPIIHPREMMPQMEAGRLHGLHADDMVLGTTWFMLGLGKKVLIADRVAPLADLLYLHPHDAGMATAWSGALCYAMQLYFDFSGYSDMALGLARMFGLEFPINFNSPYKAQGIVEFWQRWHMTLSRYLNEYLYTPISRAVSSRRQDAGKKVNKKAQATAEGFTAMVAYPTMATMLIAGIWHGAGIQFVIFGLLHGAYLTVNHAWRILTPKGTRLHRAVPPPVMIGLSFVCVVVSFVFFRAGSVSDAWYVLGTMAGLHHGPGYAGFAWLGDLPTVAKYFNSLKGTVAVLLVCGVIVWGMPNTQEILDQLPKGIERMPSLLPRWRFRVSAWWSLGTAALLCATLLLLDSSTRFLYFQF